VGLHTRRRARHRFCSLLGKNKIMPIDEFQIGVSRITGRVVLRDTIMTITKKFYADPSKKGNFITESDAYFATKGHCKKISRAF